MSGLAEVLIKYGRPFWSAIGDENAARVAGATQMVSDYLLGPEGSDAQRSFEVGRRAFKRGLRDVRYENPYGAFAAQMAGNILLGAGAGRALKVARILEELDKPFRVRPTQTPAGSRAAEGYPKRTRQQWQADLQYGKEQFNALRARGPLKREGHPDAVVTGKSWKKIKQNNNRANYDMLRNVPDIYEQGQYHGPINLKKDRTDDFNSFHWYQKDNQGITIGEGKSGRTLYNVNRDVSDFLQTHPELAKILQNQSKK